MRANALTTWMLAFGMALSAAPALAQTTHDPDAPGGGGSAAPNSGGEATAADASAPAPGATGGAQFGSSTGARTSTPQYPVVDGLTAKILPDGTAAAPSLAPAEVQKAVWAANEIIGKPYVYGGGHRNWKSKGYDCSGTVSYALHGAGLLASPLDSGSFMRWGAKGKGSWMTVWTNRGHAFVILAGLRLDTSAAGDPSGLRGPRWRPVLRSTRGFVARHPAGF